MWQEISKSGKKMVEQGLVSSHFGNISVRIGDDMFITRSGSMLDEISKDDVIKVPIYKESTLDLVASSETLGHREIYKKTSALAIMHGHSPFAVILSFLEKDKVIPIDSEGQYFLHDIPIVKGGVGSKEMADNLSEVLQERKGAIVYSHGVFATGKILEEAFIVASMIEHSCQMKYFVENRKE